MLRKTIAAMEPSNQIKELSDRLDKIEQGFDSRIDAIEAEMLDRTEANHALIQKRVIQIRQSLGVIFAAIGLCLAIYVAWWEIDADARSQLSQEFLKQAIGVILGSGGLILVFGKK